MRFIFLSLDFALLFLVIVALVQGARGQCGEQCAPENCVTPEKCEELVKANMPCKTPGTVCCSVVKVKYRTHCRHWGGECMNQCSPILARKTNDCKTPQKCCILV